MKRLKLVGLLFACVAAVAAFSAAPAMAEEELTDSENYSYHGESITGEESLSKELVCQMTTIENTCYDSEEEAEEAEGGTANRSCPVRDLFEFNEANYSGGGPVLGESAVGQGWINYNETWSATTTSFKTGDFKANFNGQKNGSGASYGEQPACTNVPNLAGSEWNNRFRSRKRLF